MKDAIRESKIMWATLTLDKYFGCFVAEVYEVLKECKLNNDYDELRSLTSYTTFYLGQKIRVLSLGELQDGLCECFQAYSFLLTADTASIIEAREIEKLIWDSYQIEVECLDKFYREDNQRLKTVE